MTDQIVVTHDAVIIPTSMPSGSDRTTIPPSLRSDGRHDSAARGLNGRPNRNEGISLTASLSVWLTGLDLRPLGPSQQALKLIMPQ